MRRSASSPTRAGRDPAHQGQARLLQEIPGRPGRRWCCAPTSRTLRDVAARATLQPADPGPASRRSGSTRPASWSTCSTSRSARGPRGVVSPTSCRQGRSRKALGMCRSWSSRGEARTPRRRVHIRRDDDKVVRSRASSGRASAPTSSRQINPDDVVDYHLVGAGGAGRVPVLVRGGGLYDDASVPRGPPPCWSKGRPASSTGGDCSSRTSGRPRPRPEAMLARRASVDAAAGMVGTG